METTIKALLDDLGKTIAVAESITAGKIQDNLASASGSSSYFEGGITVYNLTQKVLQLGVDHFHAKEVNCVSQQVADEMAKGVAHKFQSDFGVATTGYAEPYLPENIETPRAYISLYDKDQDKIISFGYMEVKESGKFKSDITQIWSDHICSTTINPEQFGILSFPRNTIRRMVLDQVILMLVSSLGVLSGHVKTQD